jgi:hypothetical protein
MSPSLAKGEPAGLSVDLARRGDEHRATLLARLREDDLRGVHIGLDRPYRAVDDQLHADGGREVIDEIGLVDQLGHEAAIVTGVDRVAEARLVSEVPDV